MNKIYATPALKKAREARGFTLRALADVLTLETGNEVSHSMISRIENQDAAMSAEIALELSKLFRIEVKTFMERR